MKKSRSSMRLRKYDYSRKGAYFVTICTQNRQKIFGAFENAELVLNDSGRMVEKVIEELVHYFDHICVKEFIVMPDHIHFIVWILETGKCELSKIVHGLKSYTTHLYIQGVKQSGWKRFSGKLWQRNFYERVIRGQDELRTIQEYIVKNPELNVQ